MTARLIDGKAIASTIRAELAKRVASLDYQPCLVVILVGDDPASVTYVRNKDRAAKQTGINARTLPMPEATSQKALLDCIKELNADATVDGILVQLPLPTHIDPSSVFETIAPQKDVDGFHPENVGRLSSGRPGLVPCTPLGVMRLLARCEVTVSGSRALVLGRSALVGRPLLALLLEADATVTVAHSQTRNLADECRRAQILVCATGRAELVRGDWIMPGATVIDVGIARLPDGQLVGDVAFNECVAVAGAITPVPGGVGPMTIACLLENTVEAANCRRNGLSFGLASGGKLV
jgi:methylenetetrahydrofolate dehydrogenase (NADP+)/methenyltetrahydrofolate cyclohydrolase